MIVRGPFTIKWRGNILEDIEAIDLEYDLGSEDFETNSGHVYQIDQSVKSSAKITFLASDIASLALVLPQYYVPYNGMLSTGEVVGTEDGAIDVRAAACDESIVYGDLDILSCGASSQSFRLKNARTTIDSLEIGKVRKVAVKFISEPEDDEPTVQFLGEIDTYDYLLLDTAETFILDSGDYLEF